MRFKWIITIIVTKWNSTTHFFDRGNFLCRFSSVERSKIEGSILISFIRPKLYRSADFVTFLNVFVPNILILN